MVNVGCEKSHYEIMKTMWCGTEEAENEYGHLEAPMTSDDVCKLLWFVHEIPLLFFVVDRHGAC